MKLLLLSTFVLCTSSLVSYDETSVFFPEEEKASSTSFFSLEGRGVFVSAAKFSTDPYKNQSLVYGQGSTLLSYTRFLNAKGGGSLGVGFEETYFSWRKNPAFHKEKFHTLFLNMGLFTTHCPGWLWKASFESAFDLDESEIQSYTLYTIALWGRYEWMNCVGLHLGMIVETGLQKDKIWPIVGVDYAINDETKLSLVYPVDISLIYAFAPRWDTGISYRTMRSRHRLSASEPVPKGLIEYENGGVEWLLRYRCEPMFSLLVAFGYTVGGELEVADESNHYLIDYKLRSAPYAACEAVLRF